MSVAEFYSSGLCNIDFLSTVLPEDIVDIVLSLHPPIQEVPLIHWFENPLARVNSF